jgi:hypothetical protein
MLVELRAGLLAAGSVVRMVVYLVGLWVVWKVV